MSAPSHAIIDEARYELRFRSLFDMGRGFTFPCNQRGDVDLDTLSERGRNNYLYARSMVGNTLALPSVERMV
jgi:hypothetical protein